MKTVIFRQLNFYRKLSFINIRIFLFVLDNSFNVESLVDAFEAELKRNPVHYALCALYKNGIRYKYLGRVKSLPAWKLKLICSLRAAQWNHNSQRLKYLMESSANYVVFYCFISHPSLAQLRCNICYYRVFFAKFNASFKCSRFWRFTYDRLWHLTFP